MKKLTIFIIIIIIIIITAIGYVYSNNASDTTTNKSIPTDVKNIDAETGEKKEPAFPHVRYHANESDYLTAFFNLYADAASQTVRDDINKIMRIELKKISNLYLLTPDQMGSLPRPVWQTPTCFGGKCIHHYGKSLEVERVIHGTITGGTKKFQKDLGETGPDQYLIGVTRLTIYTINVTLTSIPDGAPMVTITEKSDKKNLYATLIKIAKKISGHYSPRLLPTAPPQVSAIRPEFSFAFAGTLLIPVAFFHQFSYIGGGLTIIPEVDHLFVKNLVFQLPFGYYYMQSKKNRIDVFQQTQVSLLIGYLFPISTGKQKTESIEADQSKKFSLIPLLGFGYQFHIITEKNDTKVFADSFLTVQLEMRFRVAQKMHVFFTPGFNFFFEKIKTGMYSSVHLGFKIAL